jgi:hypothetical protein
MNLSKIAAVMALATGLNALAATTAFAATNEVSKQSTISREELLLTAPISCVDGDADRAGRTGAATLKNFQSMLKMLGVAGKTEITSSMDVLDTSRPDTCLEFMAALNEAQTLTITQNVKAAASTPNFDGACQPLLVEYTTITTESGYLLFAGYNSMPVLSPSKASCN